MPHRILMAIVCLHISAVLYLLLGVAMGLVFYFDPDFGTARVPIALGMFLFCLVLVVGIEVVVWGLTKRKFWAWVAGLCIFGLYAPSLFIILAGFGFWGLLDPGSRREFGIGAPSRGFEPAMRQQ